MQRRQRYTAQSVGRLRWVRQTGMDCIKRTVFGPAVKPVVAGQNDRVIRHVTLCALPSTAPINFSDMQWIVTKAAAPPLPKIVHCSPTPTKNVPGLMATCLRVIWISTAAAENGILQYRFKSQQLHKQNVEITYNTETKRFKNCRKQQKQILADEAAQSGVVVVDLPSLLSLTLQAAATLL